MTATTAYADYAQPLWRRLLLTREVAIIALVVGVVLYSTANVPNFDSPLTTTFLLLDIAPILFIALPMTMVIITGEIDLSVASTVGLSSVLVGVFHEHGFAIPVAGLLALVVGALCGAFNGFLVAYVGPAVPRRHHRHAGPLPRHRRWPARDEGSDRLSAGLDGARQGQDR